MEPKIVFFISRKNKLSISKNNARLKGLILETLRDSLYDNIA